METKICKHCKEEINKNAKICPKCGGKLGLPFIFKLLIIIIIIFSCIIGCVVKCTNTFVTGVNDTINEVNNTINETKNEYNDINGKTSFKLNESFQNKYEKITMTEVNTNFNDYSEYFAPSNGKKILMAKFEVENINNEKDELYVSSLNFNAYADDMALQTFYYANDGYDDLSATLGKGKKTIGYVFYEVPQNANKITIEYNADFWVNGTAIEFIIQ